MDVSQLTAELQGSRKRLFAALTGLTEEQFRATGSASAPDADSWNIAVHLTHLLRCERMLADRVRRALDEEEPRVASTGITNDDDPGLAQRLAVPQVIHGLQASRRDVERLLESGDAALERAIEHERLGRITARALVEKLAAHEAEHAAEVESLARQARASARVIIPLTRRS